MAGSLELAEDSIGFCVMCGLVTCHSRLREGGKDTFTCQNCGWVTL